MRTLDTMIERLRAEFLEMPGLRLTSEQVQRLCGVERVVCQMVLDVLVDARFLSRKPDGAYARLTDDDMARPGPARAELAAKRYSVNSPLIGRAVHARAPDGEAASTRTSAAHRGPLHTLRRTVLGSDDRCRRRRRHGDGNLGFLSDACPPAAR